MLRLIFVTMLLLFTDTSARAQPHRVGFERLRTPAGIELGVWYPSVGVPAHQRLGLYSHDVVDHGPLPKGRSALVVISHGTGGDFAGHVDTAVALARAGFVVAALTHAGDNWRDNSRATRIEERPPALSALISYMLEDWSGRTAIDPKRVGAFGFSAGGFTVLAAAGGRPKMSRLAEHCAENPTFFDCSLIASQPRPTPSSPPASLKDARIKAVVVAAPALGFTFCRNGLADVRVPVQLWRAGEDEILPAPFYADAVRAALPSPPEFHNVAGAGHFDFLAPCAQPAAMPQLCTGAAAFDRRAFHRRFNREVVRFFSRHLAGQALARTSDAR